MSRNSSNTPLQTTKPNCIAKALYFKSKLSASVLARQCGEKFFFLVFFPCISMKRSVLCCVATRIHIFRSFPVAFFAFHIVQWMDEACICRFCVHMNYVLTCMVADARPHHSTRKQNCCDIKYTLSSTYIFRQQHLGKCKRKYTNNIATRIYTDNIFTIFISIGITVATSTFYSNKSAN